MIVLCHKCYTVFLKPLVGVAWAKLFKQFFKQSRPAWIYFIQALDLSKGIRAITAAMTRECKLAHYSGALLEDMYFERAGVWVLWARRPLFALWVLLLQLLASGFLTQALVELVCV